MKTFRRLSCLLFACLLFASPGAWAQCTFGQHDYDFNLGITELLLNRLLVDPNTQESLWDAPVNPLWQNIPGQQGPGFLGVDNTGDGIQDDDHFDLLAAIIDGDASVVANLDPADVSAIRAAYAANRAYIQTREITINNVSAKVSFISLNLNVTTGSVVSIPIVGDTDIPSLWGINEANPDDGLLRSADPNLEPLLIDLAAAYMTVGGTQNVDYLQAFVAQITVSVIQFVLPSLLGDLKSAAGLDPDAEWKVVSAEFVDEPVDKAFTVPCGGIQSIDVTVDVSGVSARIQVSSTEICAALQRFVNEFNCTGFTCLPNLLSAAGDLNGDSTTNLDSFLASADRQEFLTNEGISNPPLQILTMPADTNALAGDPVSLDLPIAGGVGGTTNFQWAFTNPDDFSTVFTLSTDQTYAIPYAVPDNSGTLGAAVCDSLWVRRSVPFALEVAARTFAITQQPVGVLDLVPGDAHTMSVSVVGGAIAPSFQWQFSAADTVYANIDGEIGSTLELTDLQLSDSGYYRCQITGDDGAKAVAVLNSDPAFVEVTDRIRFTSQPVGGGVYVGGNFTFEVTVGGTPDGTLVYEWFNGQDAIADSDSPTLEITNAQLSDAGDYTCVISDNTYQFTSDVATLNVVERIAFANGGEPVGGVAFEGQPFTFTVTTEGGLGEFTYVWMKDGSPIENGPNAAQLTFASLELADGGSYSVMVSDLEDTITSTPVQLTVIPPFEITTQPTGAKKFAGSSHTFSIDVVGGAPPFSFQWSKNGQPLGAPRDAANRNLALENIQTSDSGSYRCAVSDQNGTKQSVIAVLDVREHISFGSQPSDVALYRGSSTTLSADVNGGFGTLQYSWKRGNIVVSPSQTLEITNAQSFTEGTYTVTVVDKDGAVTLDTIVSDPFNITVGDPIEITSQPKDAWRFETDEVTLSVAYTGGAGDVSFEWFVDDAPIADSDSQTLVLTDLLIADSGDYKCVITDGITSYPSEIATLTVIEELASIGADINVNLTAGQVVPPSGLLASGVGTGSILPAGGKLAGQYLLIMSVVHTLQNATTATLNLGEPGENGTLVEDLGVPAPPISVFEVLNSAEAAELMAGVHYMSIQTAAFPDGAIRGQLFPTRRVPTEGEGEGVVEGGTEGEGEGTVEGVVEGEGSTEGSVEGTVDGEGGIDGEGQIEGQVDGEGEGEGQNLTPEQQAAQLLLAGFLVGDTDHDGFLSGFEAVSIVPAIGQEIFDALDANGDGKLQPSELLALGGNIWLHSADLNADGAFSLSELLRAVQLFNRGSYSCAANAGASEDGYVATAGTTCSVPHAADYESGGNFSLSLAELLRLIQLYNAGGYTYCPNASTDDGFCVAE
ncbi:MAG: CHRD domain-containing protein [Candidatus Hydrogenedens sp.]|nr:CHRD domain-containing protein [Candidatus Hydrogenedens sp.]